MKRDAAAFMREEVIAANLRYGSVADPLRDRAYAHIVAKVFLLNPKKALSVERIREECRTLLGNGGKPSRESIQIAIANLEKNNLIAPQGNAYVMGKAAARKLLQQVEARRYQIGAVLDRHIPEVADPAVLRAWFEAAAIAYFSRYGDRWVASVARTVKEMRIPDVGDLAAILGPTFAQHHLDQFAQDLVTGFRAFLVSDDPADNQVLWHYGRSMFAARLMAADLSVDPISGRELADSIIVLDTNILFDIVLDRHGMEASLDRLAAALSAARIRVGYTHLTLTEYQGVVDRWEQDTLQMLAKHGSVVVSEASDAHVRGAIAAGCAAHEDFKRYYTELRHLPESMGSLKLEVFEEPAQESALAAGLRDEQLITRIQGIKAERYGKPKKREAAAHDAALTMFTIKERDRDQGAWVLSGDTTMLLLSSRLSRPNGLPTWLGLEAVLQILAVEEEGSGQDASDFAPILSRLIAAEVEEVNPLTFHLSDLRELDNLERDTSALTPNELLDTCRAIARQRLLGAGRDNRELRLVAARALNEAQARRGADAESAKVIASVALNQKEEAKETAAALQKERDDVLETLLSDRASTEAKRIKRRAFTSLIGKTVLWLGGVVLAAFIIYAVLEAGLPGTSVSDAISLIISVATPLAPALAVWHRSIWPAYRTKVRGAAAEARELVEEQYNVEKAQSKQKATGAPFSKT